MADHEFRRHGVRLQPPPPAGSGHRHHPRRRRAADRRISHPRCDPPWRRADLGRVLPRPRRPGSRTPRRTGPRPAPRRSARSAAGATRVRAPGRRLDPTPAGPVGARHDARAGGHSRTATACLTQWPPRSSAGGPSSAICGPNPVVRGIQRTALSGALCASLDVQNRSRCLHRSVQAEGANNGRCREHAASLPLISPCSFDPDEGDGGGGRSGMAEFEAREDRRQLRRKILLSPGNPGGTRLELISVELV